MVMAQSAELNLSLLTLWCVAGVGKTAALGDATPEPLPQARCQLAIYHALIPMVSPTSMVTTIVSSSESPIVTFFLRCMCMGRRQGMGQELCPNS